MDLWSTRLVLVAGWFLCSSALLPEECQPLVTPLSLADPSVMYGKAHFMMGYTQHQVFDNILKMTDSSWLHISQSPVGPKEVMVAEMNKMNGKCFNSRFNITIDGNTATAAVNMPSVGNITSTFVMLPSCEGCLALSINSRASGLDQFLQLMNISSSGSEEEIHAKSLYLLAPGNTVEESDLEHFKKQASCLGFTKEPDFVYDTKNEFCSEGEGTMLM